MRFINYLIILFIVISCVKAPVAPNTQDSGLLHGQIMVVNEGLFQQNNSTISLINEQGVIQNWFLSTFNRPLGDTGNAILQYGDKIYVVVNVSGTLEVIEASTGSSLKQISLQENNISKQPRQIIAVQGEVWITCFDGTISVVDTASLNVVESIQVGQNPEGISRYEDYVFVANSGGLNYPIYDSTLSVVSIYTRQEIAKIPIGINSSSVAADRHGNIYVVSRGKYGSVSSELYMVDALTFEVEKWNKDSISSVYAEDDFFFVLRTVDGKNVYQMYDAISKNWIKNINLPWDQIQTYYGITHLSDGTFLMTDAGNYTSNGWVHHVNNQGKIINSWMVGVNPSGVIKIK